MGEFRVRVRAFLTGLLEIRLWISRLFENLGCDFGEFESLCEGFLKIGRISVSLPLIWFRSKESRV